MKAFVDANILVYAALDAPENEAKRKIASDLLSSGRDLSTSVQAINEFCSAMRKNKVSTRAARQFANAFLESLNVLSLSPGTLRSAWALSDACSLSYWDSLIVASALEAGCAILYTEDLQNGQVFEGKLKVVNPFISPSVTRRQA